MQPQWFVQTAGRRKQIDLIQLRLMEEILHHLRLVVYPIIYKGFIHPRWLAGFLPSTLCFFRPEISITLQVDQHVGSQTTRELQHPVPHLWIRKRG